MINHLSIIFNTQAHRIANLYKFVMLIAIIMVIVAL